MKKILHCVEFKLWLNTGEYLKKNLICTRKYMCMQNIGDDTYLFTCNGTWNGWSCINEGFLNEIWYFLLWVLFIFNYISKLLFVTYIAGTFKALFLILGWLLKDEIGHLWIFYMDENTSSWSYSMRITWWLVLLEFVKVNIIWS